jgi:hypothetical protein
MIEPEKIENKINTFINEQYEQSSGQKGISGLESSSEVRDPDYFRLIYHYANEHTKNHYAKMQNYVALYGFTRTMCFVSIIIFWAVVVVSISSKAFNIYTLGYLTMLFCISSIMYFDFNKFYRRYTLEALMAFTAIYDSSNKK